MAVVLHSLPMTRHNALCNFRIVHLIEERLLAVFRVTLLGNSVAGSTNLYELLNVNSSLNRYEIMMSFCAYIFLVVCVVCFILSYL